MTLTSKRQTVFPLEWCRRQGLEHGGPLNVFDLGENGLLIRAVKPPGKLQIEKLLAQTPLGKHSPGQAAAIVNRAVRRVRHEVCGD
jgi:bifunctional DNA-binding transcriptional regulator/antitoxin component of YhaV-PrlF toxin-antitoxin module